MMQTHLEDNIDGPFMPKYALKLYKQQLDICGCVAAKYLSYLTILSSNSWVSSNPFKLWKLKRHFKVFKKYEITSFYN